MVRRWVWMWAWCLACVLAASLVAAQPADPDLQWYRDARLSRQDAYLETLRRQIDPEGDAIAAWLQRERGYTKEALLEWLKSSQEYRDLVTAPTWRPTPEQARAIRGDFLGMFAETGTGWFTAQYCGASDARRESIRRETLARGYTHLLVAYSFRYRDYPAFDLSGQPEQFRRCLDELFANRLIPVVPVVDEWIHGREPKRARIEATWARIIASVGCDRLPVVFAGWEWNDFVRLEDQRDIAWYVAQSCQNSYAGLHFTPDRWAGSPPRATDPGGPDPWNESESGFWRDMAALGIDALFFQSGDRDDLAAYRARLNELAVRLNGKAEPGYSAPYPPLGIDLVAFEFCDPHNPQGRSGRSEAFCRRMGGEALRVPGVSGVMNGSP